MEPEETKETVETEEVVETDDTLVMKTVVRSDSLSGVPRPVVNAPKHPPSHPQPQVPSTGSNMPFARLSGYRLAHSVAEARGQMQTWRFLLHS